MHIAKKIILQITLHCFGFKTVSQQVTTTSNRVGCDQNAFITFSFIFVLLVTTRVEEEDEEDEDESFSSDHNYFSDEETSSIAE